MHDALEEAPAPTSAPLLLLLHPSTPKSNTCHCLKSNTCHSAPAPGHVCCRVGPVVPWPGGVQAACLWRLHRWWWRRQTRWRQVLLRQVEQHGAHIGQTTLGRESVWLCCNIRCVIFMALCALLHSEYPHPQPQLQTHSYSACCCPSPQHTPTWFQNE
jgi:hypothetical protein